jgi:hypothetical protein
MGLLDLKTRQPKYRNEDSYIGSSDQVNPTDGSKSISDVAREKALREAEKRPEVAESMRQVERKVTVFSIGDRSSQCRCGLPRI